MGMATSVEGRSARGIGKKELKLMETECEPDKYRLQVSDDRFVNALISRFPGSPDVRCEALTSSLLVERVGMGITGYNGCGYHTDQTVP
jgi:hypothetical protein